MDKIKELMKKPWVAHLLRANARFGNRLGNQFAAAITYFSVLAMVPILMFAFAITGLTLTTLRPDLLDQVLQTVQSQLAGAPGDTKDKILEVIKNALLNWPGVGIIGILSAGYAGAGWIANLKSAVRAQWRPDFEQEEKKGNIVVETLKNFGILLALLFFIVITFGLASVATSLTGVITSTLHLESIPGATFLLRFVPMVISVLTAWGLFLYVYRVLPEETTPVRDLARGALAGAIGLVALQFATGLLMGSFSKNPAAALFGPVIVLMLFFNLFARIILLVAAWIATKVQPAVARHWMEADEPIRALGSAADTVDDHWEDADADMARQGHEAKVKQWEKAKKEAVKEGRPAPKYPVPRPLVTSPSHLTDPGRRMGATAAKSSEEASAVAAGLEDEARKREQQALAAQEFDPRAPVPRDAAEAAQRTSLGLGWVAGALVGTGLGAALGGLRKKK